MNYRFLIEYDGTRYAGWQRLPGKDTIQGKIESVLRKLTGDETLEIDGAGRTDAGVHAKGMVASANFETTLSETELCDYMNRYLPEDICIKDAKIAADRFHARYRAKGKTYRYTCYIGTKKPVFDRKYVTVIEKAVDIEAMKACAAHLTGTHDFRNFCGLSKMKKSSVRTIYSLQIEKQGSYLYFTVNGDGFLQNMVRILVGTLLEVGYGNLTNEQVLLALHSTERMKAGPTAPAKGLCLMEIDYA